MKYTVLSYNMNSYELIHPILFPSPNAEYIMVTDDPNLKDESGTWKVVCDHSLTGSPFDKTLQVRYNPWKYCDTDIVLKVDGSVGINANLDPIIDKFVEGGYDMSLMYHPGRDTMVQEYTVWVQFRGMKPEQANKVLSFMYGMEGYDVEHYRGMCQLCFQIQKKNDLNTTLNMMTYWLLKYLGDGDVERCDQAVFSFIMQKYFPNAKIMWVDNTIYDGRYMTWYAHNSNTPLIIPPSTQYIEPYWCNKKNENVVKF